VADPIETGLALSGGGYRAMLFNLGSVWRLNELGWLRTLDMITSVSGGSILNGVLATRWSKLSWNAGGVATNFAPIVAEPIQAIAGQTLDLFAGIEGIASIFSSISDKVTKAYDKKLFHGARLQKDVSPYEPGKTPRFLFYATSLQTGSSVRIERKRLADYKIGEIPSPDLPVARVVAASSAFPPVLSPVELELDPSSWRSLPGAFLSNRDDLKRRLLLTDGGVYDNMGLEAIWDRCETVLVSDAGAPLDIDADPPTDWTRQAIRVLDIVTEQTRALRRRGLMQDFQQTQEEGRSDSTPTKRKGTYWGIRTKISAYALPDAMTSDNTTTESLQHIRTRLNEFTPTEQGRLINWGYALTDAGMRKYVDPTNAVPGAWPVPQFPLS
jgi:NTE family protein